MKRMWLAYAGVTLLGVLVGVAIAGVPSGSNDVAAPIVSVTETAAAETATSSAVASTATTVEDTVVPATSAPTTTSTSTSTTTTTTTSTSTSTTSTTSTTTVPLPDRADLLVAAVNGANVAGLAGRTTELLADLGYTQTRSSDGSVIVETTVIYFAEGLLVEAERLADDIGLDDPMLLLIDDDAPFNVLAGDQLAVYVGLDRA